VHRSFSAVTDPGSSCFLVVIGLDDVLDHRPGVSPPCLPLSAPARRRQLPDCGARVATNQALSSNFFCSILFAGRITDDLRGSRFTSDFDSRESDVARGSTFFVDTAVHRVGYLLHGRFGKRDALFINVWQILEKVRLFKDSPMAMPPIMRASCSGVVVTALAPWTRRSFHQDTICDGRRARPIPRKASVPGTSSGDRFRSCVRDRIWCRSKERRSMPRPHSDV